MNDMKYRNIPNIQSPIPEWEKEGDLLKIPSSIPEWGKEDDLLKISSSVHTWKKDNDYFEMTTIPEWEGDLDLTRQLNEETYELNNEISSKKYGALVPVARILKIIGCIITLSLAFFVIHKRCKERRNARKSLKAVVIIKSKSPEDV